MEKGESSTAEQDSEEKHSTTHHLALPSALAPDEFDELKGSVAEHHTYLMGPGQCSSLLTQRIHAPPETVWSVVRRFDKPQTYKHFIKSCAVKEGFEMTVGCTREVNVISGLPAATSTERLDILDDDRHVTGFSIIGGEHRLRNYRSVTTVHGFDSDWKIWTVVLESYIVDVPEGNTEEDTRLFADTVVKLNLQKLASVTEGMTRNGDVCKERATAAGQVKQRGISREARSLRRTPFLASSSSLPSISSFRLKSVFYLPIKGKPVLLL